MITSHRRRYDVILKPNDDVILAPYAHWDMLLRILYVFMFAVHTDVRFLCVELGVSVIED